MSAKRKLLAAVGALLAILAGCGGVFALVKGTGGSGEREASRPATTASSVSLAGEQTTTEEPPPQLPCTKREARRAAERGELGESAAKGLDGPAGGDYEVQLFGCRDLTGDGLDEMVVSVRWGTSTSPAPWAVLSQRDSKWRAEFVREGVVVSKLKLTSDGVREISAAFGPDDPFCCPSGKRKGTVRYKDGEWVYRADGAPKRLELAFAGDGSPQALAGLPLGELNLGAASEALGKPSAVIAEGSEVCQASWNDLGLSVAFANLGMQQACGSEGRATSLTLGGTEAKQAGWLVDGEALIGASKAELKRLYPGLRRSEYPIASQHADPYPGKSWALLELTGAYGEGVSQPSLEARIAGGEVTALDIFVGAAGD